MWNHFLTMGRIVINIYLKSFLFYDYYKLPLLKVIVAFKYLIPILLHKSSKYLKVILCFKY